MAKAVEVAGDIVAASSAIAGLILVYVGSLTASFGTYQPQERRTVLPSYRRRAWFAFIGLTLFLLSVALALGGKWLDLECMVVGSFWLLLTGLVWVGATAILSVLEIK
jgi:hypothetical protein